MARNADYEMTCRAPNTYRAARRGAWKGSGLPWAQFNGDLMLRSGEYGKHFGPARTGRAAAFVDRSKYMPHIGNKQRAKAERA